MTTRTRITPRPAPLVDLDRAKAWLRVDHDDDDATILELVEIATDRIERHLCLQLGVQTWRVTWPWFAWALKVPLAPLTNVQSMEYVAADGATVALAPADWLVSASLASPAIYPASHALWPRTSADVTEAVTADVEVGLTEIPEGISGALRFALATWYDHREGGMPPEVVEMLAPYRRFT